MMEKLYTIGYRVILFVLFIFSQDKAFNQINIPALNKIIIADSLFYTDNYVDAIKTYKKVISYNFFPKPAIYYRISYLFYINDCIDSSLVYLNKSLECGLHRYSMSSVEKDELVVSMSKYDSSVLSLLKHNTNNFLLSDSLCKYITISDSLKTLKKLDQQNRVIGKKGDWKKQKKLDKNNKKYVINIINIIKKWPGYNEVGKTGESACFLILQHSEKVGVYKKYCKLLHQAVLEGNAPPSHYALFIDRWMINKNNTQYFGTQIEMLNNKAKPKGSLIFDIKKTAILRKYFKLAPLEYYLDRMTELNNKQNNAY